ncbi:HalOD1 output domain-containing protein [Halobium salinum]|uniref:HalOD1 output domain-containing protein n=1 Tax=Halobium salinum TaxID=1364940 RepID=A0ABD5P6J1_9EURY|nr:HalOD1 output domain-containing protein [Halobium salinum]
MTEFSQSDLDADERVVDAVRTHVAAREGVPPNELVSPSAVVDEAFVERTFRGCEGAAVNGHVTFDYDGYTVTVSTEGRVTIEPRPAVAAADDEVTAEMVHDLFTRSGRCAFAAREVASVFDIGVDSAVARLRELGTAGELVHVTDEAGADGVWREEREPVVFGEDGGSVVALDTKTASVAEGPDRPTALRELADRLDDASGMAEFADDAPGTATPQRTADPEGTAGTVGSSAGGDAGADSPVRSGATAQTDDRTSGDDD